MAWLPQSLSAQERLGAKLVKLTPLKTVADVEAVQPGDTVVMSCPKCKDSTITVVEKPGKTGSAEIERQVPVHKCPGCGAEITTVGQGKDKTRKVTHVCTHCGSKEAFCCATKKESGPTKGMEEQKH